MRPSANEGARTQLGDEMDNIWGQIRNGGWGLGGQGGRKTARGCGIILGTLQTSSSNPVSRIAIELVVVLLGRLLRGSLLVARRRCIIGGCFLCRLHEEVRRQQKEGFIVIAAAAAAPVSSLSCLASSRRKPQCRLGFQREGVFLTDRSQWQLALSIIGH